MHAILGLFEFRGDRGVDIASIVRRINFVPNGRYKGGVTDGAKRSAQVKNSSSINWSAIHGWHE